MTGRCADKVALVTGSSQGLGCGDRDTIGRRGSGGPHGTNPGTGSDGDGLIRILPAHDDPGCHNWLDTQGFSRGNVTYRHMLAGKPALVHTRLVARAGLADALPPPHRHTATVTGEQRVAQMWARFDGTRRRHRM